MTEEQKKAGLQRLPWWGWLLLLIAFGICGVLLFRGVFVSGIPVPQ